MTAVPFPVTSAPGARPQESAGRLVNAYAVKTEQGARGPLKWLRAPGLRELASVSDRARYRGFIEINGNVLAALEDRAVLIAKSGSTVSVTDLGALDGTGLITIAKNNAAPADIVAVTEEGAFNLYADDAPDNFADADLPQPNSVSGVKGYFAFTIADGRLFASDLNSVDLNSLSFATAPGHLLRGVAYRDEWFVFGDNFCQVYRDAGLDAVSVRSRRHDPDRACRHACDRRMGAGLHRHDGVGRAGRRRLQAQRLHAAARLDRGRVARHRGDAGQERARSLGLHVERQRVLGADAAGLLELDAQPHHRHVGRARLLRPAELARRAHHQGLFRLARRRSQQRQAVRDRC